MKPTIPKGWRKMKDGETIKRGDKFWAYGTGPWGTEGEEKDGCSLHGTPYDSDSFTLYIRRIAKKAGGKRK